METITNAAQAAAKAVWGDQGDTREPVSGAGGDATKGEPFDGGNNDAPEQDKERRDGGKTADDTNKGDQQGDQKGAGELDEPEQVDVKGPGPKPIETVAAEHGGDAGNEGKEKTGSDSVEKQEGDADNKDNENKGTGEEYVKSSGLQADGGDFDATNPGAGREADRLMEEKGVNRVQTPGQASAEPENSKVPGEKKDKQSLASRIKAKFRKS